MSNKQEFIAAIAPHAQAIQRQYGVPASIAIAQAALETGWGDKVKGNNFFGIKTGSSWNGERITMATHEYVNGKRVAVNDTFRAYSGVRESITNYGQLIAGSARYAGVTAADDAFEAADALQRGGYATDKKYADKLKAIIADNDLTRFDDASYRGYTQGDGFERSQRRLHEQRQANPAPWDDMMKGIFQLLFGAIGSVVAAITGDTVAAPTDLPHAAGRQQSLVRG